MTEVSTVRSFAHLLTLPTCITLFRLLIIPFIVLFFSLPFEQGPFYAGVLFLLGAATDWLDGLIARRFNMVSPFGAFLDPVADKLLVVVALIVLVGVYAQFWIVLPAVIIIAREIVISALREWMAGLDQQAQVKVSSWGKIKTFVQMVAVFWLMVMPHDASNWLIGLAAILLYIAAGLSVWSMLHYLQGAWPYLIAVPSVQAATVNRVANEETAAVNTASQPVVTGYDSVDQTHSSTD